MSKTTHTLPPVVEIAHEAVEVAEASRKAGSVLARLFSRRAAKGAAGAAEEVAVDAAASHWTPPSAPVAPATQNRVKPGALLAGTAGVTAGLSGAFGFFTRVNKLVFGAGIAAGMVGALARKSKNSQESGEVAPQGFFGKAAQVVGSPKTLLEEHTPADLEHVASKGLSAVGAALKSRSPSLSDRLGHAGESIAGIEDSVVATIGESAKVVAGTLGDVAETKAGGLLQGIASRVTRGVGSHKNTADSLLGGLIGDVTASDALAGAGTHLATAREALQGGNATAFGEAISAAQQVLGVAGKEKTVDGKALKAATRIISDAAENGAAALQREGLGKKISGIPDAIRRAPQSFGNASLSSIALKGALVTGNALQVAATAKGIGEKTHVLKQIYCDMTGESKVSTRKLMFSRNVPPLVKELRSQIIKEYGPRMVLNMLNTAATYTFLKGNNMKSMLGSAGLNALTSLHDAKVQSYAVLPMYQALNQMPEISEAQYAQFITAASKDAARAGGAQSPLVQALARDYAEKGTRPSELLQEVQSGQFDQRALALVQAARQKEEVAAGHDLPQQASYPGNRAVVGGYTQREAAKNRYRGAPGQEAALR